MPISTRRATTCSICASVARSSITTTMASVPSTLFTGGVFIVVVRCDPPITSTLCFRRVRPTRPVRLLRSAHAAPSGSTPSWTTRRSSRRASSMIRSNSRATASAPSGPSAAMLANVRQHFFLPIGLIDLDALLLFQAADLADAARPLVQQPDQHLVDPVDVAPQIVKSGTCHGLLCRIVSLVLEEREAGAGSSFQPSDVLFNAVDQRRRARSLGNQRHQRAADDRGIGITARPRPRARAGKCRSRARSASTCARESCATSAAAPDATVVARAGHAEPRDAVQEAAAPTPPPVGSAHRSSSGSGEKSYRDRPPSSVSWNSCASSIGRSSASTPSTPALAASRANVSTPIRIRGLA